MPDAELNISRVLRNPLIRRMLEADHVPVSDFAQLRHQTDLRLQGDGASLIELVQSQPPDC